MDGDDVDLQCLEKVIECIDRMPKPLLVHCRIGLVAGSIVLAREASLASKSMCDVVAWANDLDVKFAEKPKLYETIQTFLEKEQKKTIAKVNK